MAIDRKQQILEVAKELFLHYGFKKVTLVDIAKELGVSRPTVYQVFPNKEEIFKAIIESWTQEALTRIRTSRRHDAPVEVQLKDAIDIWVVQPYQLMATSANAEEIMNCSYGFARDTVDRGFAQFEELLMEILSDGDVKGPLDHSDLAHFTSCSLRGFKVQVKSLDELKRLVNELLVVVLNTA